jgi:hypothetical protein
MRGRYFEVSMEVSFDVSIELSMCRIDLGVTGFGLGSKIPDYHDFKEAVNRNSFSICQQGPVLMTGATEK